METRYKWPMNGWPKDKKFNELGKMLFLFSLVLYVRGDLIDSESALGLWMHEYFSTGLQGLSLALFTRGLGWSAEELEVLQVAVRNDMKKTRTHAYYNI